VANRGPFGWGDNLIGMFCLWTKCKREGVSFKIAKDPLWELFDSTHYTEKKCPKEEPDHWLCNYMEQKELKAVQDLSIGTSLNRKKNIHHIICNMVVSNWESEKDLRKDARDFFKNVLRPSDLLIEKMQPMVSWVESAIHVRIGDSSFDKNVTTQNVTNVEETIQNIIQLKLPRPMYVASDSKDFIQAFRNIDNTIVTWENIFAEGDIVHCYRKDDAASSYDRLIQESMLFYYIQHVMVCEWSNFSKIPALLTKKKQCYMLFRDGNIRSVGNPMKYLVKMDNDKKY